MIIYASRALGLALLLALPLPALSQTRTDDILPQGINPGSVGTRTATTTYTTVITSVSQSLSRVSALEVRGLQQVTEVGANTTAPVTLGGGGQILIPSTSGTTNLDARPFFLFQPGTHTFDTAQNASTYMGAFRFYPLRITRPPYPNAPFVTTSDLSPTVTIFSDTSGTLWNKIYGSGMTLSDGSFFNTFGIQLGTYSFDSTTPGVQLLRNSGLRVWGSELVSSREWAAGGGAGAVIGDNVLSERDVHAERNVYARKNLIVGDGRQAIGTAAGSIVFGHNGNPSTGWAVGSTVGILESTTGIVQLSSRISTDTINMANPLTVQNRRVPVILAKNTTVRTVTADTEDYAEFSFTLPAADAVAGTTIEIDVGGPMAGFGLDDNTYEVELLVDGANTGTFACSWTFIDPYTWQANYRVTLTSPTAGRWIGRVEPDDQAPTGQPVSQRGAGTWTASGDITFLVRCQRGGDFAEAETITMDWSEAVMTRP